MIVIANALQRSDWLVSNFGPRCTLVSAASALRLLGAQTPALQIVQSIEKRVDFKESRLGTQLLAGPHLFDYIELPLRKQSVARAIEAAARECGVDVQAEGRLCWNWNTLTNHLREGGPVLLNCLKAPSGATSHTVICVGYDPARNNALITVDPNDGGVRLKERRKPSTGIIVSVTLIKPR